jgi:hypothetical protein
MLLARSLDTHIVVPANAGTHSHQSSWLRRSIPRFARARRSHRKAGPCRLAQRHPASTMDGGGYGSLRAQGRRVGEFVNSLPARGGIVISPIARERGTIRRCRPCAGTHSNQSSWLQEVSAASPRTPTHEIAMSASRSRGGPCVCRDEEQGDGRSRTPHKQKARREAGLLRLQRACVLRLTRAASIEVIVHAGADDVFLRMPRVCGANGRGNRVKPCLGHLA